MNSSFVDAASRDGATQFGWSGLWLFLGLIGLATQAFAQDPRDVYVREIQRSQTVAGLPENPFGEEVDLYTGTTAFRVHDIDLRGTSALPVRLSRLYKPDVYYHMDNIEGKLTDTPYPRAAGFGIWEFEIPYIHSRAYKATGWRVDRCSFPGPPMLSSQSGPFTRQEVWNGYFLSLPGVGSKVIYEDIGTSAKKFPSPNDGFVYEWLTRDLTRLRCIPSLKNGYPGEGFVAVTTSGVKYFFDWGYQSPAGELYRRYDQPYGTPEFPITEARQALVHVYLLATRVEDAYGNWVNYEYNSQNQLRRISSNDGRWIQLDPITGGIRATTSSGSWIYQGGDGAGTVTFPDGSVSQWSANPGWRVEHNGADNFSVLNMQQCRVKTLNWADTQKVTFTHQSGLVGTFEFQYLEHHRAGMLKRCQKVREYNYRLQVPNYWEQYSLVKKTVSGVGVPPQITTYDYSASPPSDDLTVETDFRAEDGTCTACRSKKTVTATNPDGSRNEYVYGLMYDIDEGDLLESRVVDRDGQILQTERNVYMTYTQMMSQPYSDFFGRNWIEPMSYKTARFLPVVRREVLQSRQIFVTETPHFDRYVRPTSVTRSSVPTNFP